MNPSYSYFLLRCCFCSPTFFNGKKCSNLLINLESRIIGGVGIIGGLDIVTIINNRGVGRGWKNSCPQLKK